MKQNTKSLDLKINRNLTPNGENYFRPFLASFSALASFTSTSILAAMIAASSRRASMAPGRICVVHTAMRVQTGRRGRSCKGAN